ncbi:MULTISPECIES: FKBP-type peptidyl-prolyl cis-trans isomerase [unclassified Aureispira]|uniref:FKBP-type peptidyl-prolyl cis-trans isomerase n=1 Tax=unclassified Aureispira TaxID=2649989 RepID=UPI000696C113|nr:MULTISPECIES: FKBP-type peptidyl-prolyl cis-trans isomerase [unclassified Aureispira]WMX17338.1 FKBP-type peptidyl-prolyl cis-trans isomerase [Aureispira sp. CCB-E]
MRYLIFLCFVLSMLSCQKEAIQHDNDIQLIKDYLLANNINATEDKQSNLFYHIYVESGDSVAPIRDNDIVVEVKYKAYLLDGTSVYNTNNLSERVDLDKSIYGWQLALPHMDINDKMLLFLPSRLAYGEEGHGKIPPNSVVIFDIELIEVFPHF